MTIEQLAKNNPAAAEILKGIVELCAPLFVLLGSDLNEQTVASEREKILSAARAHPTDTYFIGFADQLVRAVEVLRALRGRFQTEVATARAQTVAREVTANESDQAKSREPFLQALGLVRQFANRTIDDRTIIERQVRGICAQNPVLGSAVQQGLFEVVEALAAHHINHEKHGEKVARAERLITALKECL
jgi:hypothetical protein